MIETLTITGVDEDTEPGDLLHLARWFPFVELAVLAGTREGEPRFPRRGWIDDWLGMAAAAGVQTAVHLCGARSRAARDRNWNDIGRLARRCGRVQVNLPQDERDAAATALADLAWFLKRPVIVQHEGPWETSAAAAQAHVDLLSDSSGGRGIASFESWPQPRDGRLSGYAGGIGPETITEALGFTERYPDHRIWLDLESGVRTDGAFDTSKAIAVCSEVDAARQRDATRTRRSRTGR